MRALLAAACFWLGHAWAQPALDTAKLAAQRDAFQTAIVKRDAATVSAMLRGGLSPDFNFNDLNQGRSHESPLTMAIHREHLEIARILLDAGASVSRRDGRGRAAIHGVRSAEAAKLLVSRGADPNAPDVQGQRPVAIALDTGNLAMVDALRAVGASFDGVDLLANALQSRKPDMFDQLLARGADPRKPPTRALWMLVESGDTARAKALIDRGADPSARNDRESLLARAVFRRRWEIVEALVDAGASLKTPEAPLLARLMTFNPDLLKKLAARGLDLNAAGTDGHTALTALIIERPMAIRAAPAGAAAVGVAQNAATGQTRIVTAPPQPQPPDIPAADNVARIKGLLAAGADPNRKHGEATPLMVALAQPDRPKEIALAITDAGGRIEFDTSIQAQKGDARPGAQIVDNIKGEHTGMNVGPVGLATVMGRPDVAVKLLQRDRLVSRADRHLLYFAAATGGWDVVLAALPYTKEVNAANRAGVSPLMLAAYAGEVEAVRGLLAAGASVNARSASDWPPLLERPALWFLAGHPPSRPHLVGGYTALRAATERNHTEVARLLSGAGGRP